jgi:hypothetical protein
LWLDLAAAVAAVEKTRVDEKEAEAEKVLVME